MNRSFCEEHPWCAARAGRRAQDGGEDLRGEESVARRLSEAGGRDEEKSTSKETGFLHHHSPPVLGHFLACADSTPFKSDCPTTPSSNRSPSSTVLNRFHSSAPSGLKTRMASILLRTRQGGGPTADQLSLLMRTIAPDIPVYDVKTLQERRREEESGMRLNASLLIFFAACWRSSGSTRATRADPSSLFRRS